MVRLIGVPSWLDQLPEESKRLYLACMGKEFLVKEVEPDGVLVIDVSAVGVPLLGASRHILMVDPPDVEPVELE